MTYEFKNILNAYKQAKESNQKTVLATVVSVDGSSYRGAGVRMLVLENNQIVGAISGGCVEKEVVRQCQSVFETGESKIMTYDGRFRLGCEGTLYVLLENFSPTNESVALFEEIIENRKYFKIHSSYNLEKHTGCLGSFLELNDGELYSFGGELIPEIIENNNEVFSETMKPCFRLVIIGTEHDAVRLCLQASNLGWEVIVVATPNSLKDKKYFTGVKQLIKTSAEDFYIKNIDQQTAFVLMNHNYAKDLLFLKSLKNSKPCYIGLLGPSKRKEQMLSAFIEYHLEVEETFLDVIYGPAGLHIGAETPEEIAVSIIAEIIAISRKKKAYHLQDKKGSIHDREIQIKINES